MKTCCFSGRRDLSKEQKEMAVIGLVGTIEMLIEEGYTKFISGFAEGVDLIAANIIIQNKKRNKNLILEAALPHNDRLKTKDTNFHEAYKKCDEKYIAEEKYISNECYLKRNRYMIDNSDLLIAVWDNKKTGGTYYTINYAKEKNKEVKIIYI